MTQNSWIPNNATNSSGIDIPQTTTLKPTVEDGAEKASKPKKKAKETCNETFAKDEIKVLEFLNYGWCEELKRSYNKGFYMPKNKTEFEALQKYAIRK